jgi:hypothetical protein
VVDNASSDNTTAAISEAFPLVQMIASPVNLGFPKANNIGFARARGRYLLALNPDTQLLKGALQLPMHFLESHAGYGCVGVKTLLPSGKVQYHCARQFPTLRSFVFGSFFLDKIFPSIRFFRSPDMPYWDHEDSKDVEMIQGAYMMFRRDIYKEIGGFDERIPMFLEDGEYCLRLSRHGCKIRYLADAAIIHYVGQSTGKSDPRRIASLRYEANYLFLREYQGGVAAVLYMFFIFFETPLKLLLLPFFSLGLRIKSGNSRLRLYFWETVTGWLWLARKVWINLLGAGKDDKRLSFVDENSI